MNKLKLDTAKTKFMVLNEENEQIIDIKGTQLENVKLFKY